MSAAPTQPLWSVQYLRAIAACAVLFSHIQDLIPAYAGYFDFSNGRCGVDIFFVISGFIMVSAARADNGRDFLARRIIRIVPLYWLLTLALAAVGTLLPQLLNHISVLPVSVLQSLFFIPHMMGTEVGPLLQPGWTLNYEMAFYFVFALFFAIPITRRVAVIGAVFTALVMIGVLLGASSGPIAFKTYTSPLLLEFVAGMALGLLVQNNKRLPPWLSGIAILALFTNHRAAFLAFATIAIYIFVYTPMKRISSLNTLVGAIPGALPPLIGWVAARGNYNIEGCLLFATLWFWQMPHFLAIAWMYKDDYADGGFVMLTANDPEGRLTSRQALLYTLFLVPVTLLPSMLGFNTPVYFLGALALGLAFTAFALRFIIQRNRGAARNLFFASIIYLPLLLGILVATKR